MVDVNDLRRQRIGQHNIVRSTWRRDRVTGIGEGQRVGDNITWRSNCHAIGFAQRKVWSWRRAHI